MLDSKTVADHLAALEAENAELKAKVAALSEPMIKRLSFEDGRLDAELCGAMVENIAVAFGAHFRAIGAKNYVEMRLFDKETEEAFVLTCQRVGAKSPHELREAAEAETVAIRARLAEAERVLWRAARCLAAAAQVFNDQTSSAVAGEIGAFLAATAEKQGGSHD